MARDPLLTSERSWKQPPKGRDIRILVGPEHGLRKEADTVGNQWIKITQKRRMRSHSMNTAAGLKSQPRERVTSDLEGKLSVIQSEKLSLRENLALNMSLVVVIQGETGKYDY